MVVNDQYIVNIASVENNVITLYKIYDGCFQNNVERFLQRNPILGNP